MKATDGRRRFGAGLTAGILAAGLALAGCSASGTSASSAGGNAARGPAAGAAPAGGGAAAGNAAAPPTTGSKPDSGKAVAAGHAVIFSGEVQLQCAHVDATLKQAEDVVSAAGGFVDSETSGDNGFLPTAGSSDASGQPQAQPLPAPTQTGGDSAQAVFKVPTTAYDATYQQLLGLGAVLGRERASQDVTAQVVDLASRIRSQQASIDRVNALMKQAGSLNDIVALESALTQRETDLESMQSQLAALQNQVAMSTITVQLFQKAAPPVVAAPKQRGAWSAAGHALAAGCHGLYLVGRALLVAFSAMLPFLLLLLPIVFIGYRLARRRKPEAPE
ncbi:DUF4349 domain-containing protein [Streptacidiphilus rugosus]|uniref:DUF4349 domain-containing protein n=1 Tax=Streptacidiphilus rugosus TaxID=405783 RepID=UPI0005638459|nr:DUF4349 domain-containing protein [Streptacidiphilus rugosus]